MKTGCHGAAAGRREERTSNPDRTPAEPNQAKTRPQLLQKIDFTCRGEPDT
jgi:hypothetical protein